MLRALLATAFLCALAGEGISCEASFYGSEMGPRTANGERFNPNGLTAASRSLPFGTRVKVTCRGRSVTVRINDRGPYSGGRCLDVSRGAAVALGMIQSGTCNVSIERVT